jgi:hypothetical protein
MSFLFTSYSGSGYPHAETPCIIQYSYDYLLLRVIKRPQLVRAELQLTITCCGAPRVEKRSEGVPAIRVQASKV